MSGSYDSEQIQLYLNVPPKHIFGHERLVWVHAVSMRAFFFSQDHFVVLYECKPPPNHTLTPQHIKEHC